MRIMLKNSNGSFEIGGGEHSSAHLIACSGLGIPEKETKTVTFSSQAGVTLQSMRDSTRTITITFDFFGNRRVVENLYKIIYAPVEILFFSGSLRRKISGVCIRATEIDSIIYNEWQSITIQFFCAKPYFEDLEKIIVPVEQKEDHFPNLYENGEWFVNLPAVATTHITEATINNFGAIAVYPIITIYNNAESVSSSDVFGLVIVNASTGAKITLEHNIAMGETIIFDLPRRRITSDINNDITNKISDDTVLGDFTLVPGENIISAENKNKADDITAQIEYINKYAAVIL